MDAVRRWGPAAGEWVRQVRSAYPAADADGVARLATARAVRLALAAGGTPVRGPVTVVAGVAALGYAQVRLVLRLAAAYGLDPAEPERAVDLLVLTRVHPDEESAARAVAAAEVGRPDRAASDVLLQEAVWRLATPAAAVSARWFARWVAGRIVPGGGSLVGLMLDGSATERLAHRAVARFRHDVPGQRGAGARRPGAAPGRTM
ncbi:hypothetical protein [Rhizomonospora bruguierae]|uniref:hypothetical protein n=1 Tax=Rhizomonospora bruguierae TaxID=1581705 RepID=UPI001BD0F47F|nr:hypothetical protein [Micromonospora sp. NBRC 107566]